MLPLNFDGITDLVILSDDRVRIYRGDNQGNYNVVGEISLPDNLIATGIAIGDLFSGADIVVTLDSPATPTIKTVLIYNGYFGSQQTPKEFKYSVPISIGDSRIGIGQFGAESFTSDIEIVNGDRVTTLLDINPSGGGSAKQQGPLNSRDQGSGIREGIKSFGYTFSLIPDFSSIALLPKLFL